MNHWMTDPRAQKGEEEAFEAERAERSGDFAGARARYVVAGEAFAGVATSVPASHPNTRSDLAVAAAACFARAGDFGQAIEIARRMLAEGDALTERGRTELSRLAQQYAAQIAPPARTPAEAKRGG